MAAAYFRNGHVIDRIKVKNAPQQRKLILQGLLKMHALS